jgi:large conductance mechanosensitive channel
MSFIKEFKTFALKGNALDLAIGVIIGAAFGKIVSSLVSDICMPLIALLTHGVDFTKLSIHIGDAEVKYGVFIQNIFEFFIIALCIFFIIKAINKLFHTKKQEQKPSAPSKEEQLLSEIRDLLKEKKQD